MCAVKVNNLLRDIFVTGYILLRLPLVLQQRLSISWAE